MPLNSLSFPWLQEQPIFMASRQELNLRAIECEQTAYWSPPGVTEREELPNLYIDKSLVVEQNDIFASCYPITRNLQPSVSDVEPIQVGSMTQGVLEVIDEPPIPIHNIKVEETLGDIRPDCYCEESTAHGPCTPCDEWVAIPTPLEEHLCLSTRADRLRF